MIKNLPAKTGDTRDAGLIPGAISWRRAQQPTPVFLPGEYHGQRSLAGYSPLGSKESDTAEQLHFHFHSASWASQGVNNTFAMQETWI